MSDEEVRVAYTRGGKRLHAATFQEARRVGKTLCGHAAFRHPKFDKPTVSVGLSLKFNAGCERCLRRLES